MTRVHVVFLALAALASGALFLSNYETQARPTAAAGQVTFSLDCSPSAGIQTNCSYPSGTTTIPIEWVVTNSGDPFRIGALGITMLAFEMTGLTAGVPALSPEIANPEWYCGPPWPAADLNEDADPLTVESYIGCYTIGTSGPLVATGETHKLVNIMYAASSDGVHTLSQLEVGLYDGSGDFAEVGFCGWGVLPETAICPTTIIQIGNGSTATPTPAITATPTPTSTPTRTPTRTHTPGPSPTPCIGDMDVDEVLDCADNCPSTANPDQANNDRNFLDNSPPYLTAVDDKTMAMSDAAGDACDDDNDNDGIKDGAEQAGTGCGGIATASTKPDTDGDRFRDGAECTLGTDPTLAYSRPTMQMCAAHLGVSLGTDTDADKLKDFIEFCYYGTDPNTIDSDGDRFLDGASDGCEAASFNGDRGTNVADMGMLASAISNPMFRIVNIDINKDGVWNPADQGILASFISGGVCPPAGG